MHRLIDNPDGRPDPVLAALPDRLRLPIAFPPGLVAAARAEAAPPEWTPHFVRDNYVGEWSAVALRAPAGAVHPILQIAPNPGIRDWVETPLLLASPALSAMLKALCCPLGAARLMRLAPGTHVHRHADPGLDAAEGTARLHIPLATDRGAEFLLNDTPVEMQPGECWYLRLADPHALANRGKADRIHLVVDAQVDPWLASQLVQAHATAA